MKVLLDTCVWGGARSILEESGHDVIWAGDWDTDPGDAEILMLAHREGRILVTLDKDFGELAIVYEQPHAGIVRLVNLPARQQGPICARVLASHGEALQAGAIVTVESHRLRIRLVDE
ncbi:DUF5615 family PIN-like protein [Litorilinea aerophila]|uniref:Toxin-antitoxin system, toxin component, PIN family protein n=1 Tax=Litorilinea aerophila TaxID=1204385 RepID=A0A540VG92_9CHLR|nr:DUF5615 family PIN-like protein [Litorilinea aerophila]MCC9076447.1 DUF5615 family PIN-like protein [Litorilinea aerophila]